MSAPDVEALGGWLANYLGNYTLPANYVAPLYDQTHREVAKYVGPVIAEDLLASDWLAAHDAEVRRATGEHIAQAIEAGVLPSHPNSGYRDGFARAASIAREVTR